MIGRADLNLLTDRVKRLVFFSFDNWLWWLLEGYRSASLVADDQWAIGGWTR